MKRSLVLDTLAGWRRAALTRISDAGFEYVSRNVRGCLGQTE